MKSFGLLGVAGYVALRHMRAIKGTHNDLDVAMDPFDSVGVMDEFFPEAAFFKDFAFFERYIYDKQHSDDPLDYMSICTPNYLHETHALFSLKHGMNVVCEKPLVITPWELDSLVGAEKESGGSIYTVLQLRVHPLLIALRERILKGPQDKVYNIDLTYLTSRGPWFYKTWKLDIKKSGGIVADIGIHFFDLLLWIFGDVKRCESHICDVDRAAGYVELERARVRWFMSINPQMLPEEVKKQGQRTYRSLRIDDEDFEFSDGFTNLHTVVYQNILSGKGCRISDARKAIEMNFELRQAQPMGLKGEYHPYCHKALTVPPFVG